MIDIIFSIDWKEYFSSPDNILEGIKIIFTIIGGMFALIQWHRSNKIKRADFIRELINIFYGDDENRRWIYIFDYEDEADERKVLKRLDAYLWQRVAKTPRNQKEQSALRKQDIPWDSNKKADQINDDYRDIMRFLRTSHEEETLDKFLFFANYLCYLNKMHFLTKKEFSFFKYDMRNLVLSSRLSRYRNYVRYLEENPVNDLSCESNEADKRSHESQESKEHSKPQRKKRYCIYPYIFLDKYIKKEKRRFANE